MGPFCPKRPGFGGSILVLAQNVLDLADQAEIAGRSPTLETDQGVGFSMRSHITNPLRFLVLCPESEALGTPLSKEGSRALRAIFSIENSL